LYTPVTSHLPWALLSPYALLNILLFFMGLVGPMWLRLVFVLLSVCVLWCAHAHSGIAATAAATGRKVVRDFNEFVGFVLWLLLPSEWPHVR
jgi:NADH:ubiquinone oxidoreductase subunit K